MSRGLFAGATDYSHQSFKDVLNDLEEVQTELTHYKKLIENKISELELNGYWATVPSHFKNFIDYCLKYFQTSIDEIKVISQDIQIEVQENHCKRLYKIATIASKINNDIGRIWHSEYRGKDYQNLDFKEVEEIYAETRQNAVELLDVSNMANRLEDFIGKSFREGESNENTEPSEIDEYKKWLLWAKQHPGWAIFIFVISIIIIPFIKSIFSEKGKQFATPTTTVQVVEDSNSIINPSVSDYSKTKNKFRDDVFGILIPKFTGADRLDNFGGEPFNEILERNLHFSILHNKLNDIVELKLNSNKVNDEELASELGEKFNAKAVIFGEVTKLDKTISVLLNFSTGTIGFGCKIPYENEPRKEYRYDQQATVYSYRYKISFKDDKYNMDSVIEEIVNDLLFYIVSSFQDTELVRSEKMLINIPHIENRIEYLGGEQKGFYFQSLAFANYRRNNIPKAIKLYEKSYKEFCILKEKLDSGITIDGLSEEVLRKFAGVSMHEIANLYLKKNDTSSALKYLSTAAITDESFKNIFISVYNSFNKSNSSDSTSIFIESNSPFMR